MNSLQLDLTITPEDLTIEIDGIQFEKVALVSIAVDNCRLLQLPEFEGTLVNFWDLKKSRNGSGLFLVFTAVSGVADDAGWDYITVEHFQEICKWRIVRDDHVINFVFSKVEYEKEIGRLEEKVMNLPEGYRLEPKHVIPPE